MDIADWSGPSGPSLPWVADLAGLKARMASLFRRPETRRQVGLYLDGLIGTVERKTGWQLAEHAGDTAPWRIQAVLGRSVWDADAARARARRARGSTIGGACVSCGCSRRPGITGC